MSMSIILPAAPLLRIQLDKRINPHNSHTRLDRTLQLLHFTHTGLQHARLETIMYLAIDQVEAVVLVVFAASELFCGFGGGGVRRGRALREGVAGAELGDELGAVFGGIYGEGFGDAEEGVGEGGYGELFAGALLGC
jgi:hypothetical protein